MIGVSNAALSCVLDLRDLLFQGRKCLSILLPKPGVAGWYGLILQYDGVAWMEMVTDDIWMGYYTSICKRPGSFIPFQLYVVGSNTAGHYRDHAWASHADRHATDIKVCLGPRFVAHLCGGGLLYNSLLDRRNVDTYGIPKDCDISIQ